VREPGLDTYFVYGVVVAAAILIASGRVRRDGVALLVLLSLMLSGILSPAQALSGFGNPVVPLVAGIFVLGEAVSKTGIAHALGAWMLRVGAGRETRLLSVVMLVAAALGSIMSSGAVVAILVPAALAIASKANLNPSRLLLPLGAAALISGMLTLISSASNLIVSAELVQAGLEPFRFFSFTPIGIGALGAAMLFVLLAGRRLLDAEAELRPRSAAQTLADLRRGYGLEKRVHRLRVGHDSELSGRTLLRAPLAQRGIRALGIERAERFGVDAIALPGPAAELRAGDVVLVEGDRDDVDALIGSGGLESLPYLEEDEERWAQELGSAVVLVHPESSLVGISLREADLPTRYGVRVLGLRRSRELKPDFVDERLEASDSLLVVGPWHQISLLQQDVRDFVVLALPLELDQLAPARSRAPLVLAILAAMVALCAFDVIPVVAAVLMAALASIAVGCVSGDAAYRAIPWSTVVLIGGLLPAGDALLQTGGADVLVQLLDRSLVEGDPRLTMALVFAVTTGVGVFLSGTSTAIIMAPIALEVAELSGVSPRGLAMVVAIAASAASFVSPTSTSLLLVIEAGGYRYYDVVRVCGPILLLTAVVTLVLVPWLF